MQGSWVASIQVTLLNWGICWEVHLRSNDSQYSFFFQRAISKLGESFLKWKVWRKGLESPQAVQNIWSNTWEWGVRIVSLCTCGDLLWGLQKDQGDPSCRETDFPLASFPRKSLLSQYPSIASPRLVSSGWLILLQATAFIAKSLGSRIMFSLVYSSEDVRSK